MRRIFNWMIVAMLGLLATQAVFAHGISEEAKQRMIDGGNWEYFLLGAEHMVTGYDHLLFLFGVVFFLTRVWDILKFVTAFTIGHTITLVFATYFGITANYFLVDAFIALTVIYKGFENLGGFQKWLGIKSPNAVGMVLFFGLVHGFGLSTRLQQLPVDQGGNMLAHILSFNAGVEIGQIGALLVMFAVLYAIRKAGHHELTTKLTNGTLMFLGALLLIMQLHGYSHEKWREDFPISRDDHAHAHLEAVQQPAQAASVAPSDSSTEHGHAHNPDGSHMMPSGEEGHAHNPDGSHAMPGQAEGHAHNPDGSHAMPDQAEGHAHNPDGSHVLPSAEAAPASAGEGHAPGTPPHP